MEDLSELVIEHALKLGAEYADVRIESARGTSILVMDGRMKTVSSQEESGCGVRAFVGGAWGFSATSHLTKASVKASVASAVGMAKAARSKAKVKFKMREVKTTRKKEKYPCRELPSDIPVEQKVSFALSLDDQMKEHDPRIASTSARYDDVEMTRVVANSFGALTSTEERWVLAACVAYSKEKGLTQKGHSAVGRIGGFELIRTDEAADLGATAASQAVRLLDSKTVPAGKSTCVLDGKMTGILAHEAFGHACEADAVLSGSSVLVGRIGQKIADERITLVDDPTIKNTFGYFSTDWEGVRSRRNVLVDKGVLRKYLHSIETSSRMGVGPTGSARAQAYNSPPVIRMSNTYIEPGDRKVEEMIGELRKGILVQGSQYGYVEPAKGQFMFKCDEAYEIKNGEVGQRYREATLSGVILDVFNKVVSVSKDFYLGDPGYCGKSGQAARVTDGGPHLCVADIVVGGLG